MVVRNLLQPIYFIPKGYNLRLGRVRQKSYPAQPQNLSITSMPKFRRKQAFIATVIAASFGLVGCGPSPIEQCNKLIATINKGSTLVNAQKERYDAASHQNLALELSLVAKQLDNLELEDKNLQQYQSRFVGLFRELSQAFTEMGFALEAGHRVETNREGRRQLEEAKTQLTRAGQKANQTVEAEDTLIRELQNYCQAK